MKQFFILIAFVLTALIGTASADANPVTPHSYITQAIDSVCRIEIYENETKIGGGSGFVVEADEHVTKIITARHVVEKATKLGIILHGKEYITAEFFQVFDTDAAMVFIKPGIAHAQALEFNLDFDNSITQVNAFGFWGRSKLPGTPQMLTMTTGWADRRVIDSYSAPDYKVINGLLMGNVLLYPGYSGGPVLDNDMKVIGVNILLSSKNTMFVDSRHLWNSIANLNKGKKIRVPYCYDYDILNTGSHKRVPVGLNDVIRNGDEDTTIGTLQDMIMFDIITNGIPGMPPSYCPSPSKEILSLFNSETIIIIGEKKYLIASVGIMANGLSRAGMQTPHPSAYKYIYLCQHNAEIVIELAEMPKEGEVLATVDKRGAFFRYLVGRHSN